MKTNLLAIGAFALALALPLGVCAQQTQYPAPAAQGSRQTTMPSAAKLQHHWMKRLSHLNLSGDQQQHIQSLINQFSQAHPEGSPREPGVSRELRRQIMGVLTSDQQNQLHQERRARHQQRGGGQQGNGQGQPGPQDQAPPPSQEQPPGDQPPADQPPPDQQQPPAAPPA